MERLHFMDSGGHSLINLLYKQHKQGASRKLDYSAYRTEEFWRYVDSYAAFIKRYQKVIDFYANVDVIRHPRLTWKVQKYMEREHGLNPVPVVHWGTSSEWLERYIERGYPYIALGGRIGRLPYTPWADRMFDVVCSTPNRLPCVRIHGFSVTTHKLIVRYPWYSIDSTTWRKMSYNGQILVPRKIAGEYSFSVPNLVLFVDETSKYTHRKEGGGKHFLHLPRDAQKDVLRWLELIDVPFGSRHKSGRIREEGVSNAERWRQAATIRYYLRLVEHLPDYPWPFEHSVRKTLYEALGS